MTPPFYCFNHNDKAATLIQTLSTKYRLVNRYESNILFVLTDNNVAGRITQLQRLRSKGVKVFFNYPHAARANLYADIFTESFSGIKCEFVVADGHIEVMRAYGYKGELESIGWYLCPMKEFTPIQLTDNPINVLFAPIHPRNEVEDRQANHSAFRKLQKLHMEKKINLSVRWLPPFEGNGIPMVDGIRYIQGSLAPNFTEIDKADVVVAHQTFAYIAVARGKPVVGLGEDIVPHTVYRNKTGNKAKNWNSYKHLLRYPVDIEDYEDVFASLQRACLMEHWDWRKRHIGEAFDSQKFLGTIEKYL